MSTRPTLRRPRFAWALRLRCPLCGEAPVFRSWLHLHERCAACGWRFTREPGYFLGSIYLNYGLTTVLVCALFFGLHWLLDVGFWPAVAAAAVFVVLFPLWFLRYARALWMWMDLVFDTPEESR